MKQVPVQVEYNPVLSSVVQTEPQESHYFALTNRNRNALRFRNRIWIQIQHKME